LSKIAGLLQIAEEEEDLDFVLVVPIWPARKWWPKLLDLVASPPVFFPRAAGLFTRGGRLRGLPRWHACALRVKSPRLLSAPAPGTRPLTRKSFQMSRETRETDIHRFKNCLEGIADLNIALELSDVESIQGDLQELRLLCGSKILPEEEIVMYISEIADTDNITGLLQ
jgi:hypothetical protein